MIRFLPEMDQYSGVGGLYTFVGAVNSKARSKNGWVERKTNFAKQVKSMVTPKHVKRALTYFLYN